MGGLNSPSESTNPAALAFGVPPRLVPGDKQERTDHLVPMFSLYRGLVEQQHCYLRCHL